jgi:hypothetical protein
LCKCFTAAVNVAGGGKPWPGKGLRAAAKKAAEAEAKSEAQQNRRKANHGGVTGAGFTGASRPLIVCAAG